MILKVSVESGDGSRGYAGFVEITPQLTLAQLRVVISRTIDVDSLPSHYQFIRNDGLLVGSRGEHSILASRFLPCITLMPTPESPIAGSAAGHAFALPIRLLPPVAASLRAVQVKVVLWTGAVFRMWALSSCTFAQLRTEASRHWRLNPADTLLTDDEGAAWPDAAFVHDVLLEVQQAVHSQLQANGGGVGAPSPLEDVAQHAAASAVPFILRLRDPTAERALDPRGFKTERQRRTDRRLRSSSSASEAEERLGISGCRDRRSPSEGRGVDAATGEHQRRRHAQGGRGGWDGSSDGRSAGEAVDDSLLLLADGLADDPFAGDDFASTAEGATGFVDGVGDESEYSRGESRAEDAPAEQAGAGSGAAPESPDRREEHARAPLPPSFSASQMRQQRFMTQQHPASPQHPLSPAHALVSSASLVPSQDAISPDRAAAERLAGFAAIEPRLWRVFTWYACAGDATDPFHIRGRQWRCLLDDCGLLVPDVGGATPPLQNQLTPETAHLVFSVAVSQQARKWAGAAGPAVGALGGHPGLGVVAGPRLRHTAGVADSSVGLSYIQVSVGRSRRGESVHVYL
jgi:hypothetical protein